jgi:hypothetical protein
MTVTVTHIRAKRSPPDPGWWGSRPDGDRADLPGARALVAPRPGG